MTTVFVPKEIQDGETRVAATPETVKRMIKLGLKVTVEGGAGEASKILDQEYVEAGASIGEAWDADVVLKVNPPEERKDGKHETELLKEGALLLSLVWSVSNPALAKKLSERKLSVLAMEAVPRISRAQKMDVLSSQANLAGYKAVLMGANAMTQIMPMMVTAAGTIKPAKCVVMGAGVAGLQAIATARRLGAVVEATDIRPEVKEQVESLGGKFIETVEASGEGGYAKELTDEQKKRQAEIIESHLIAADLVICTALIPGRPAPKLISASTVEKMKEGAVIVDLAVSQGGNCELAETGIVTKHGVTIVGEPNVPATLASDASAMYARNILALVMDIVDRENDAAIKLDLEDEVIDGALIIKDGEVRNERTKKAIEDMKESE
ncbi:MAG TPA: Re/Si-specific NAD(P)(+) transhydrogenase subunit alpha [Planctomycetes bacterium]|nr:Re/Si-specific NAD(P)(+) transhydrogenase subunit alpha [Planctomycetota bacterium]